MQLRWLLGSLSLAGVSLAAASDPLGEWTVSDVHRTKSADNTICDWHFAVTDSSPATYTNSSSTSGAASSTFVCEFNVTTPSGQDCGASSFSSYPCSGNGQYTINGGHSTEGFVVITLVNPASETQAFFGFLDSDLDAPSDIQEQTKPVYHEFPPVKANRIKARQSEGGEGTPAGNWTVEDMFRGTSLRTRLACLSSHVEFEKKTDPKY